jgi:hypothetical protein
MYIPFYTLRIKNSVGVLYQDPMYAPFVKGGPEGLEESWEAGISTVEGDIYIEKAVRGGGRSHRPAPEDPPVTARPGWTDLRVDGPSDPSSSAGNVMFLETLFVQ